MPIVSSHITIEKVKRKLFPKEQIITVCLRSKKIIDTVFQYDIIINKTSPVICTVATDFYHEILQLK